MLSFVTADVRREIFKIALPVSLESTVQLALGFVNQVIVGTLGTATIAAVGLANNVLFIGILCLNTLGAGCAILASRARGRGDEAAVKRIVSFFIGFSLVLALLLALPLGLGATPFLKLVGADQEITSIGGPYLSLVALSLPLITLSVVSSAAFRSIGRARIPMLVTIPAITLIPLLSWVFVFPLEMGAVGAAVAALVAQGVRAGVLLWLLLGSRWGLRWAWPEFGQVRRLLLEAVPLVLPLFITEVVFSGGVFLFALLFERLGTQELAVFQIVSNLEMVFITASAGLHYAATVLVAQAIGRADSPGVWGVSRLIWRIGLISAAIFGLVFALFAFLLPLLYPNTTPQVQQWAFWAVLLNALFQPVKVSNFIFFGTLASGGDTRFLLLSDFVTVFLVGLPLAWLLAFPLGLGLWGIFLGRLLGEETVRVAMFLWRYRGGHWFRLDAKARALATD
ncbi:MATE family efflux transporter [Meiothermus sp. CFH 77666]|uniref:MATE family efflux transporter n=1 Tax=Meiothermus sp. CFH 77666 TaxID=2817942 RepID=UPI001AA074EF|nr:MATE family efflux transporter [Meiothermus sp. CFH 77666]MBO1437867.1 MATE family efflux transporter [Meiothermus sp. CFH 77666]